MKTGSIRISKGDTPRTEALSEKLIPLAESLVTENAGDVIEKVMMEILGHAEALERELNDAKHPRIYTRCPSCRNDTLTINNGHLLCTWHDCKDPTMIDRMGEPK